MCVLEVLLNAKVTLYLHNIIRDYIGIVWYYAQTASGMVKKEMTCEVPQGSALRPLLWNIAFGDILKEEVPLGVSIIWYADDTLVVMAENDIPMLEWKVNTTCEAITRWTESAGP